MKLIRSSQGDSKPRFGVVIGDRAVAFTTLQQRSGVDRPGLSDSRAYLAGLPASEQAARELWRPGARRIWANGPRAKSRRSRKCGCTSRSRWWRCSTSGSRRGI